MIILIGSPAERADVLSEEVRYASNTATMGPCRATQEEPIFTRNGAGNELAALRYAIPSCGRTEAWVRR
jgi:hypothetical protein